MLTGSSTEPWLAVGRSGKMCLCLGTHRRNLDQSFVLSRRKAAVSSRHSLWDEIREAESVF